MKRALTGLSWVGLTVAMISGCTGESTVDTAAPAPSSVATRPPTPPPAAPRPSSGATINNSGPAESQTEMVKAETGVGKKGSRYGGGIISEPISAYFRTQGRINFLQMERGMRDFKALNDRAPNSHEEFMEKIIREYGVKLPELPDGQTYLYDTEQEELMVQKPAE